MKFRTFGSLDKFLSLNFSDRTRSVLIACSGLTIAILFVVFSSWPGNFGASGSSNISFISYSAAGISGGAAIPACGGSSCAGAGYWECGGGENSGCNWVATGPIPGTACYSNSNACGEYYSGEYDCSSVCTVSSSAPADPSWYGQSCTESNVCGQSASGTYNCGGTCSVSSPSLPSGYGSSCTSSANACGETNTGTIGCDGQCSVSSPDTPSGYGTICTSATNSCGAVYYGTIGCSGSCSVSSAPPNSSCASPSISASGQAEGGGASGETALIRAGVSCRLIWSASPATSCSVSGGQYSDSSVGTSGTLITNPLTRTTDYVFTCYNGSVVSAQKNIKCQIIPDFKEI
mgnify:CR=1 FL=1